MSPGDNSVVMGPNLLTFLDTITTPFQRHQVLEESSQDL